MKTDHGDTIEVLTDLLKINNDRIEGYRKAVLEVKEFDLKTLFEGMADESRKNASELTREIRKYGGDSATDGTTTAGKIYRAWMDVKTAFTGKDRQSVLNSCEYGEDAAQRAYKEAIASDDLPPEIRQIVRNQQASLKSSHDLIKSYRDGRHVKYDRTF